MLERKFNKNVFVFSLRREVLILIYDASIVIAL